MLFNFFFLHSKIEHTSSKSLICVLYMWINDIFCCLVFNILLHLPVNNEHPLLPPYSLHVILLNLLQYPNFIRLCISLLCTLALKYLFLLYFSVFLQKFWPHEIPGSFVLWREHTIYWYKIFSMNVSIQFLIKFYDKILVTILFFCTLDCNLLVKLI